jgi:hypothetical protein
LFEGRSDHSQFHFRGKVIRFYMAPKSKESPRMGDESPPNGEEIPTGWSVKSEVENDGTITTVLKNLL